ncbi:Replicative DNA helicase [compost metagenome]
MSDDKNNKKTETIDYNEDVQRLLLQFMISDPAAFARSQNIIKPEYWNDRLRGACRFVMKYSEEYSILPTSEMVKAETGVEIDALDRDMTVGHNDWYMDTIEEFCRHKAMEALVWDGPDLVQRGMYSELERRSKENMLISLQKDMGTDYFTNPLERLHRMRDRTGMTSTGWRDIDAKLYGGMNRGELTFFAGGPGTGKSLFLQNLALNWVQMGLNIVYVTLELSEELVGLRFDAMISEMPTKQIFKNMDETAMKVSMAKKSHKWGRLHIKKFPEAGTSANDIRAYLKEYEIQNGFKPDGICVDYLDLLHPNSGKVSASDLFIKDKYTSEELRALAAEYNLLAATASQLNRASIQEQSFDASHMAGGISKINTADNVLAIFMSPQMKEIGQYNIQFLKTRSSSGVGSNVFLKFNLETLRIVDHDDSANMSVPATFSKISEEIKKNAPQAAKAGPKVEADEYKPGAGAPPKASGAQVSMLRDRIKNLQAKGDF